MLNEKELRAYLLEKANLLRNDKYLFHNKDYTDGFNEGESCLAQEILERFFGINYDNID